MILYDFSWNALWSNILILVPSRIGFKKCCCSRFHMFFHEIKFKMIFFSKVYCCSQRHGNDHSYDFSWKTLWSNIIFLVPSRIALKKCCCSMFHMFFYEIKFQMIFFSKFIVASQRHGNDDSLWFLLKCLMIKHHNFDSITNWVEETLLFNVSHDFLWHKV